MTPIPPTPQPDEANVTSCHKCQEALRLLKACDPAGAWEAIEKPLSFGSETPATHYLPKGITLAAEARRGLQERVKHLSGIEIDIREWFAEIAGADSTGDPVVQLPSVRDVLTEIREHYDLVARENAERTATAEQKLRAAEEWAERLLAVLRKWLITPEYDFPGDSPELCGYSCLECRADAATEEAIEHKPECELSTSHPAGAKEGA